jgi:hypothetical protein
MDSSPHGHLAPRTFLALLALYNRDGEFQFLVHQIFGLSYVPQQYIISVYEKVILTYLDQHSPEWEDQAEKIESFRETVTERRMTER